MLGTRWWLLLLILQAEYKHISCSIRPSREYTMLFNGGQQVSATYNTFLGLSTRLRCAALCTETAACWLFMWDYSSRNCHLLEELNSTVTLTAASSTAQTFYVSAINGKKILRTPSAGSWTGSKTACENMGGRLFLPEDTTYSMILHYLYQRNALWYGMYSAPSDNTVWYNMDGKVDFLKPKWYPGEPNGMLGNQYYISTINGYLNDDVNGNSYLGVCEV